MQILKIFLLRQPVILWGDAEVKINRRALRHLLFYLACQPEVSRAQLSGLFWEEGSESELRARLRTSLSKLRAALPDPDILVADSETVQLDRSRIWVDVQDFRNLVKFNLRPARQVSNQNPMPEALAQNLRRAVDLWDGHQFWAGADFLDTSELEAWLENQRQSLFYDYLHVLERLAYNAAAHGDLELALTHARRLVEADPLNDTFHANLLTWLIKAGRNTQALEYSNTVRVIYNSNDTPLPDDLHRLIESLNQESPLITPMMQMDPWPKTMFTNVPFLNREQMVQTLKQSFQRGGIFTVAGEAGVGKTRLVYEVFRNLEPEPRLILANGRSSEQDLPLQAMVNALRQQVTQAEWLALDGTWAALLTNLLPELRSLRPDLVMQSIEVGSQAVVFEALHQVFNLLARTRKLLFILDNAQWCDPATLDALATICNRGFFIHSGILVVNFRPEELSPPLQKFLLLETAGLPAMRLSLARFSLEEVERMAQYVLGQPIPLEVAQRLARDSGGNPLFILEILYHVLNSAPIDLSHLSYRLPASGFVHPITRQRLHRLNPNPRRVIEAMAVLGDPFSPELLEAASSLSADQVVNALEELEQAGLIEPIQGQYQALAYQFVYSTARDVIVQGISRSRRRLIHLRAARTLEATHPTQPNVIAARLANHYENAGEAQLALQHWITAGKYALHQFSPEQAQSTFSRAEQLLMQDPSTVPDALVYQLYSAWNDAARASANAEQMHQVNTRFLELAEKRLNTLLVGSALNGLAATALHSGDYPLALNNCNRAGFYLDQAGDLYESVRLCNIRGDCLSRTDQFQAAIKAFSQSLLHCEQTHDPRLLDKKAHAQCSLSEIYYASGYPIQVGELAQGCLKSSLLAKNPEWNMKAHFMLVMANYYQGRLPEALDHVRQGAKLAVSLKNQRYCAYFATVQSRVELAQGWLYKSWQHYLEAQTLGAQDHPPHVLSLAASQRGQTLRFLRQFNLASQAYRDGIDLSISAYDRLECQFRLGLSLAGEGKIEESLATLRDCLTQARAIHLDFIVLLAEASLLVILTQTGQVDQVKHALPALIERASGRNIVEVDISIEYIQSQLALFENRVQDARLFLTRAAHKGAQAGILWWELQSWIALAQTGVEPSQYQARVQKLLDTLSQHSHHLPDLAEHVRLFKQWVKHQLEYT